MANIERFIRHDDGVMYCRVDSATVIEIGDAVFLDTDDVKPASSFTWNTNLTTTQTNFQPNFVGIARSASGNGDTDLVRVQCEGHFKMATPSATYNEGELVGLDEDSTTLHDQTVETVASAALAIGTVVKAVGTAATEVEIRIHSEVYTGVAMG